MKPVFALAFSALLLPATLLAQSDLSLGEPVNPPAPEEPAEAETAEPGIGDTYAREVHGDWAIRCTIVAEDEEFCHMFQLLIDADDNPVASLRIAPIANSDGPAVAAGEFTAPLETALQAGVTIGVDNNAPKRYPFAFCTDIGCHARIGFAQEDIGAFRRGAEAKITLVAFPAPDEPVNLTASLTGFTAGYNALTAPE